MQRKTEYLKTLGNGKIGENEMKNWKPIFIENSRVPVWLSYLAPINIAAITLFFLVFSREKMSEVIKRHETIHFQQMLETGVVGFVVYICGITFTDILNIGTVPWHIE